MHPLRHHRSALATAAIVVIVSAPAAASTITFKLDGPTAGFGASLASSATFGGETYTLSFSSPVGGSFQTNSGWGLELPTFSWTSASVSLTAPSGTQLLFTGYRQYSGFNLAANSTFDFGTSLGNALPSTGSTWPPPPAVDYVAQGAFVMAHGDTVTFANNAVWGGINAAAWIESLTFRIQPQAVPGAAPAWAAASLFSLAGSLRRRRR